MGRGRASNFPGGQPGRGRQGTGIPLGNGEQRQARGRRPLGRPGATAARRRAVTLHASRLGSAPVLLTGQVGCRRNAPPAARVPTGPGEWRVVTGLVA